MIRENSFTHQWVSSVNQNQKWGRSDAQLKNVEKAIMALHLLEQLALSKMQFIFKGGTSLLLHFQEILRFSIDIDILIAPTMSEENVESFLDAVVAQSPIFVSFEKDVPRTDSNVLHYKVYYRPYIEPISENPLPYILLDAAKADNPYERTVQMPIRTGIIDVEEPATIVTTPSPEGLLGDKLTAFAPDTIGVPITAEPGHRPKRVEALKQLYDVSNLFEISSDIEEIRKTYRLVALQEIEKRKLAITPLDALNDTLRYSLLLGNMGTAEPTRYRNLAKGIPDFCKFVADRAFSEIDAARCAGKAAYLVELMKNESTRHIERFSPDIDMTNWELNQKEYKSINELKMVDPEAFFYWYHALT